MHISPVKFQNFRNNYFQISSVAAEFAGFEAIIVKRSYGRDLDAMVCIANSSSQLRGQQNLSHEEKQPVQLLLRRLYRRLHSWLRSSALSFGSATEMIPNQNLRTLIIQQTCRG